MPSSWRSRPATPGGRCPSGCSATPPRWCPSCSSGARRSTSSPTRPRPTTRCSTCRSGRPSRTGSASAPRTRPASPSAAQESMARHVRAMVEFQDAGAEVFDYGNSIRDEARKGGYDRAFEFPGFVPAYIRPLFCEGKGPFRWAALSGDPADIAATDRAILELFPDNERLHRWITMAQERVEFQGLPARICWLGYGERHLAGLKFNEMVASGELQGADRDRPRPPRLRVRRVAVPRDRGDARRLRRHRRLGPAQRAGQHRVRRDLGRRSTTAAASASAGRSTPARSASRTAPTWPRRRSSGCSRTTPAWASSGTSTPATTAPPRSPVSVGSGSRCRSPDVGRYLVAEPDPAFSGVTALVVTAQVPLA